MFSLHSDAPSVGTHQESIDLDSLELDDFSVCSQEIILDEQILEFGDSTGILGHGSVDEESSEDEEESDNDEEFQKILQEYEEWVQLFPKPLNEREKEYRKQFDTQSFAQVRYTWGVFAEGNNEKKFFERKKQVFYNKRERKKKSDEKKKKKASREKLYKKVFGRKTRRRLH